MATDPRRLRPSQLCRLLNSTPLGEVATDRLIHQHRSRAGLRIGDAGTVDLVRYAAWLVHQRHAPPLDLKPAPDADPYGTLKARARARTVALSLAGRDIGELPPVADPARKAGAGASFRAFCDAYFPRTFHLPWSRDHLAVLAKTERAVRDGGLFALAMPRGAGKSCISECACVWALLYGHRDFVCLVGSDEGHALEMLEAIKTELEGNDLLLEDFPEAVYPIHRLDGIANRAGGQLYRGERTHIGWTAREIVLPTIPGSAASGAVVRVAGLTGRIRGMKHKRADGRTVRPSLVVLDDPQTDESARSLSQCAARESILAGAVLGLAGPGRKIAGIMPCTVIRPGDMADAILDRAKHPEWNGERTRMVDSFPTDAALWARYAEIRAEGLRCGDGGAAGTAFYAAHRAAMDAGAAVAWPERFDPDELSAVQHAMNLRLRDEAAFFAEYQNEPLPAATAGAGELTPDQVAGQLNRLPRGTTPLGTAHLSAFIDVHENLLYWVVAAWEADFTGAVVDYGAYPDQHREYFTLRDATRTLGHACPGGGFEGALYAGLERVANDVVGRRWLREDGTELRVEKCLVDANWGASTDLVYQFCRRTPWGGVIVPSHGRYVGASSKPFDQYTQHPGDRAGLNWRIPAPGKRAIRHVSFDANFWKSFVHARLDVPVAGRGSLTLFGERAESHRLFAEHLTAEYRVKTEGRGRVVDEWKVRPGRSDNHWFDGVVGCAVGASMLGVALASVYKPVAKVARVSLREMQEKYRAEKAGRGNRRRV